MLYTIDRADKHKDYRKRPIWTKTDITDTVVMPILDVARLDRALDTSGLTFINNKPTATKPFTRFIIRTGKENIYRTLHRDTVELITHGANREYRHNLELIEPTKELERFVVDNTTITNLLAFLYDDIPFIDNTPATWTKTEDLGNKVGDPRIDETYDNATDDNPNVTPYNAKYLIGQTITFDFFSQVGYYYKISNDPIVVPKWKEKRLTRDRRELITPSGATLVITGNNIYKFEEAGIYTLRENYSGKYDSGIDGFNTVSASYEWKLKVLKDYTPPDRAPKRYTIKQVLDEILSKIASETTAPRIGLDKPLFSLDPNLAFLDKEFSPEFTFTQNTLFGVLEQVGNYIHAIPRLVPTPHEMTNPDGTTYIDDWSDWSTITFDFLGKGDKVFTLGGDEPNLTPLNASYEIITTDQEYNGENYATSFVSNVQNSFQTNKQDYISLVEPYEKGFVSARTEDGNFEISNDTAVIKTSRPIQRIVSLEVGVELTTNELKKEFFTIDITPRVKEETDYNLLIDYAQSETDILKTKSSAIYFTRGSNVIRGLDYYPPKKLDIEYLFTSRAIQHIISIMGRVQEPIKLQGLSLDASKNIRLKDLMFRIKYIPYYNFKAMQYKAYVDENGGNNTIFYNQQDSQQVDIESLGENVRGALMMTANKEFSMTGYSNGNGEMKVGDELRTVGTYGNESNFYAYQINREFIDRNTIKNTIIFSKNFNKWNDYIAIKKNYREWEISNRESIETNPICNQFCVVSHKTDFEGLLPQASAEFSQYLKTTNGFINRRVLAGIKQSLGYDIYSGEKQEAIRWVYAKTKAYNDVSQETEIREFFLPCACFGFGTSLILSFATQDNYSAGTTVEPGYNNDYALENFVEYGSAIGNVDTMELAYGHRELKRDGFSTNNDALASSKEFYKITANEVDENNIIIDFRGDYPFNIKKDSRQQLNFTTQLNFVADEPNIWISPNLVNQLVYVGAKYRYGSVKWAYFGKQPDLFIDDLDPSSIVKTSTLSTDYLEDYKSLYLNIHPDITYSPEYVGVGLVTVNSEGAIDKDSKILLYYNKNDKNYFYLKLRSRI